MKPMSSFFGLQLRTSVKIVCKSFLLLVLTIVILNLYTLDYQGPREESIIALGVVFLFLVFLTLSAFVGHSGADREGLCLVVLSLWLLVIAIIHWITVGIISMQKSSPDTVWQVCIQNRCAETFWLMDMGYRIPPTNKKEVETHARHLNGAQLYRRTRRSAESEIKTGDVKLAQEGDKFSDVRVKVLSMNLDERHDIDYNENEVWENEFEARQIPTKRPKPKPIVFWKRFTERDYESSDPSTGVSLLVTLILFLMGFVYFFTCATIICSYSSELYEYYRSDVYEEEAGTEEETAGSAELKRSNHTYPN